MCEAGVVCLTSVTGIDVTMPCQRTRSLCCSGAACEVTRHCLLMPAVRPRHRKVAQYIDRVWQPRCEYSTLQTLPQTAVALPVGLAVLSWPALQKWHAKSCSLSQRSSLADAVGRQGAAHRLLLVERGAMVLEGGGRVTPDGATVGTLGAVMCSCGRSAARYGCTKRWEPPGVSPAHWSC